MVPSTPPESERRGRGVAAPWQRRASQRRFHFPAQRSARPHTSVYRGRSQKWVCSWRAKRALASGPVPAVLSRQTPGLLSDWVGGAGILSLPKWVVSTKYFLLQAKVSRLGGFSRSSTLQRTTVSTEKVLASSPRGGSRDSGSKLALLRINFLFSTKGHLPHFVPSMIDGRTSWLAVFSVGRRRTAPCV